MNWIDDKKDKPEQEKNGNTTSFGITPDMPEAEKIAVDIEKEGINLAKTKTVAEVNELLLAAIMAKVLKCKSKAEAEAVVVFMVMTLIDMPIESILKKKSEVKGEEWEDYDG